MCVSPQGLVQEISDLRLRVSEMDSEKLQYEKKLKSTKVSFLHCKHTWFPLTNLHQMMFLSKLVLEKIRYLGKKLPHILSFVPEAQDLNITE